MVEKTKDNIITALKYYIPIKYWDLNDWDIIVKRELEVEKNVFRYKCSFITLYFNGSLEPVSYDKQYVIGNNVYYDMNKDKYIGAGTYTYLGKVKWDKQSDWGI